MGPGSQIQPYQSNDLINPVEEDEIIRRIINGEKDLYTLIIRKYNQRLYRIALSIINRESEVQDIMQAAYIKAYENLNQFKFQSGFSTWLTKILINESLMYLKKADQTAAKVNGKFFARHNQDAADLQTPLMKVLNSELKNLLESSIRGLPKKYRTIFIMREVESMNVAETMECLGLSEANVKVRLNRAKVMLRNKLGEYVKDDEVLKLYKPICDRIVGNVMKGITIENNNKTGLI